MISRMVCWIYQSTGTLTIILKNSKKKVTEFVLVLFSGENLMQFVLSSDISYIFKKLSADMREKNIVPPKAYLTQTQAEVCLEMSSENSRRSKKPGKENLLKELHLLSLGKRNLSKNMGNCLLAEL